MTILQFKLPITPHQLRKLRGAIIESVLQYSVVFEAAGIATTLFHNHIEMAVEPHTHEPPVVIESRATDYPKIQYKIRHQQAEVFGIGEGAKALSLWASLVGDSLTVSGIEVPLLVAAREDTQWEPKLTSQPNTYRLNKWLPFSPKHFEAWKNTPKLVDKAQLLDGILWGHLWHLIEGLAITVDKEALQLNVSTIDMMTFKNCYGVKKLALDVTIITNLNLPNEIGVGQGITIGFGKIQLLKQRNNEKLMENRGDK